MTLVVADRVKETTTSTGTGNITLAGAAAGYRAFSVVCVDGDTVGYLIEAQTPGEWETGMGAWHTGNILSRTAVSSSSNADTLVNFSAGVKNVVLVFLASQAVQLLTILAQRFTAVHTTASIAANATINESIPLAKGGKLHKISANKSCWIVMYSTAAARAADANRRITKDPTPGAGVIAEFQFTGNQTLDCGPRVPFSNGDGPSSSTIYARVTDLSGTTGTITLTFTYTIDEI